MPSWPEPYKSIKLIELFTYRKIGEGTASLWKLFTIAITSNVPEHKPSVHKLVQRVGMLQSVKGASTYLSEYLGCVPCLETRLCQRLPR